MRNLLIVTLLCCGLFVNSAAASTEATPPRGFNPAAKAEVDQIAQAGLVGGITGITVEIHDPKLGHYVKSYGSTDGTPVTPGMHYRIASVSAGACADRRAHPAVTSCRMGVCALDRG